MKWTTAGVIAAVVPGGVLVAAGAMFAAMYAAAATGIDMLDRWAIRGNAVLRLVQVFGVHARPAIARAYVAGVLANEGAYTPRADGTYPLGDVGNRYGPSVGPGQVLSGLHLARLGYTGDPLALARVGNESQALYYSVRVFREAWDEARQRYGADADEGQVLSYAITRYNGSGPAADAYAARALDRIVSLGGFAA